MNLPKKFVSTYFPPLRIHSTSLTLVDLSLGHPVFLSGMLLHMSVSPLFNSSSGCCPARRRDVTFGILHIKCNIAFLHFIFVSGFPDVAIEFVTCIFIDQLHPEELQYVLLISELRNIFFRLYLIILAYGSD